ncbi:protein kinase domain-containing protein [Clostridium beijerinckii]|uniref:Serine/threonine-protein kinase PknL n=1 Tax=Clostridium beijerinckii TaxID=1520 RepID=A0A1S8S9S8_CLOBE|nr:protein kinase [Clostridium beijerinckii]NRY60867.1 hypothetical protein [Clostridium beijerinckii]OOM62310.1 serine/threonine-protein kinase PknL [Clostridium beijerinckii]
MENIFEDKVKECLIKENLWKNGYHFEKNPNQRGQSFNFFVVNEKDQKIFIAKFFDYLADFKSESFERIDEFSSISDYIEWISNSDNSIDVEQVLEATHYVQRSFNRYVEVCSNYNCGFPKLYANEKSLKINGSFYGLLIEEVIVGITLDKHIKRINRDSVENNNLFLQVVSFINEITKSLALLNQNNIVHRDLSPDNIIYNDGIYTIIDPGVIKMVDRDKTRTFGFIFGKRSYVSPEQFRGYASQVDFTSDLYSLGVISFEFVLGYNPLKKYIDKTNNPHKDFFRDVNRDIEDDFFDLIEESTTTKRFYQLLCKMVQVERRYRFETMDEFREFFDTITMEVGI